MRGVALGTVALAIALAAAPVGCRSTSAPGVDVVADSVHLAYGVQTPVPGAAVSLTFEELIADTRCPPDILCVSAGVLTVGVHFEFGAPRGESAQEFSIPGTTTHVAFGYRFDLIAAAPRRASTEPPMPVTEYWIALRVSRLID